MGHPQKTSVSHEQVIANITKLIEDIAVQHRKLGVTISVNIYQPKNRPKYILSASGELLYAKDQSKVALNKLTPQDLDAIDWQLRVHLARISQPTK